MKSKMPQMAQGRPNNFQTKDPHIALPPILKHVTKDKKIWCNASGEGRMVDYLRDQGYEVTSDDLIHGFDFLSSFAPIPDFDVIIENPPYDVKDKWLQKCFDLGKPFALLLPATAIGEQQRVKMYKKYGIQILLPDARTDFITPNGTEGGGWFYAAWFCWKLLPKEINFVD